MGNLRLKLSFSMFLLLGCGESGVSTGWQRFHDDNLFSQKKIWVPHWSCFAEWGINIFCRTEARMSCVSGVSAGLDRFPDDNLFSQKTFWAPHWSCFAEWGINLFCRTVVFFSNFHEESYTFSDEDVVSTTASEPEESKRQYRLKFWIGCSFFQGKESGSGRCISGANDKPKVL